MQVFIKLNEIHSIKEICNLTWILLEYFKVKKCKCAFTEKKSSTNILSIDNLLAHISKVELMVLPDIARNECFLGTAAA